MSVALMVFSCALFVLVLSLLEMASLWWDLRFGERHRVLLRMNQWDSEPVGFSVPTPFLRTTLPVSGLTHFIPMRSWWMRRRLLVQIEAQMPDGLDFISRALRAGHDLPRAMQLASAELRDPLARELRYTVEDLEFGAGLPTALRHLGERVPLGDLRTFIVAATLHRETGGDITRVFDSLAHLIRARATLRAEVRVASTEGRISAFILSVLPLMTAFMVQAVHPGLLHVLIEEPMGRMALGGAVGLWLTGIVLMIHIIHINP
jgi:tight adherence protein B